MRFKRALTGCVCMLFLGALAGCGAGGGGQAGEQPGSPEPRKPSETTGEAAAAPGQVIETIEVKETEFALNPARITLDKPGTYVFKAVNTGAVVHSLEIEGKGIEEETPILDPGQDADLKVTLKPGTYEMYCPVGGHRQQGMDGTVTVGQGPGGQGAGGY
jgi:plastocyanin